MKLTKLLAGLAASYLVNVGAPVLADNAVSIVKIPATTNPTCSGSTSDQISTGNILTPVDGTYPLPGQSVTIDFNGASSIASWQVNTAQPPVNFVIVRGRIGSAYAGANIYVYANGVFSDTNLFPPPSTSLRDVSFCFNQITASPATVPQCQSCSIGDPARVDYQVFPNGDGNLIRTALCQCNFPLTECDKTNTSSPNYCLEDSDLQELPDQFQFLNTETTVCLQGKQGYVCYKR
jgi:hypothetical protein